MFKPTALTFDTLTFYVRLAGLKILFFFPFPKIDFEQTMCLYFWWRFEISKEDEGDDSYGLESLPILNRPMNNGTCLLVLKCRYSQNVHFLMEALFNSN